MKLNPFLYTLEVYCAPIFEDGVSAAVPCPMRYKSFEEVAVAACNKLDDLLSMLSETDVEHEWSIALHDVRDENGPILYVDQDHPDDSTVWSGKDEVLQLWDKLDDICHKYGIGA